MTLPVTNPHRPMQQDGLTSEPPFAIVELELTNRKTGGYLQ